MIVWSEWKKKFCWWPIWLTGPEGQRMFWFTSIEERRGISNMLSSSFDPDEHIEYRA